VPTMIYFCGRDRAVPVRGSVEEVAAEMKQEGPVRLTTVEGSVIFVKWSNVLYVTESGEPD
jgi:hypothetical protein